MAASLHFNVCTEKSVKNRRKPLSLWVVVAVIGDSGNRMAGKREGRARVRMGESERKAEKMPVEEK